MDKMTFMVAASGEGMATTSHIGSHRLVIDADAGIGGTGAGPNPMETILLALAACENITTRIVAGEMEFDLQKIDFEITAELDPQGVMGNPMVQAHFEKVEITVRLRTQETEDRIRVLKVAVEKRCPAYSMFKAANIEMIDRWIKV